VKHVIYIPGLSSEKSIHNQKRLMFRWPRNIRIHTFEPRWDEKEDHNHKYARLVNIVHEIDIMPDDILIVIGVSAGGSLAVRLLYDNKRIDHAFLVSGKLKGSGRIGQWYRDNTPALLACVKISEELLDHPRQIADRTVVVRPLKDNLIPIEDMLVDGAKTKKVFAHHHTVGIVIALLTTLPKLIRKANHRVKN